MDLLLDKPPATRFLSMHPRFGPESYVKRGNEVTGLRIVVTGQHLEPGHDAALAAKSSNASKQATERCATMLGLPPRSDDN